ncbi:glycolipid 2-alpha-mannosyltransferase-domain-containing protein, partial [Lentinula aff. detonsa]
TTIPILLASRVRFSTLFITNVSLIRPDIKYFCDVTYDPFDYLRDNKKTYGFTISFYEWEKTIPTLWATVK